jgi:hypothetical protein
MLPGGKWVWGLLMAGALILGLSLLLPRGKTLWRVLLVAVLISWFPITSALVWANINSLVFLLLALAWRFPGVAGWAIGVAAAAKLVPILGVFWLAGRRDWRGAAIALAVPIAATAVILVWTGPETLIDFVTLRANQWTPEQGLKWGLVEATGIAPAWALVVGIGVACVAFFRRSFALAVFAMLLSVPVMHAHYFTWALVPMLGVWHSSRA